MPRILKADLLCQVDVLAEELEKLRGEHAALRRECGRSRSPRRITESASTSRAAWDLVCRTERDEVVHEQRETIIRLRKEIESLTRGEGLVRPILVARWESSGALDNTVMTLLNQHDTTTVSTYIKRLGHLNQHISDMLHWGASTWDRHHVHSSFAGTRAQP